MRIIAGRLGGRPFDSPRGHRTHPMSDKMRGALFNTLGDIEELTILDAFAGSGALGLEALSRGAASVIAIDVDKGAAETIVSNSETLRLRSQIKVIRANASSWSDNNSDMLFDLVLLDPPYDQINVDILMKLANHTKPDGIAVFSLPPTSNFVLPATDYNLLTNNTYGDSQLVFYRKM